MPQTIENVVELIEQTKKIVVDYQTEYESKSKEIGEKSAGNETSIKAMETKFSDLSTSVQKLNDEKTAEGERIKDLERKLSRGFSSEEKREIETTPEIKSAFDRAMRLQGGTYALPRQAIEDNLKEHVFHYYKHMSEERQGLMVKNLMAEGSEAAGGMFCPVPMDTRIRRRIFETSPVRQVATVINVSTQAMFFALDDQEIETVKAAEVDTREKTDIAEFGQVRIDVHEISAKPQATLTLLEDNTINLEGLLPGKVSREMGRKQNFAFVSGDGDKEAKGFLSYPNAGIELYERFKIGTQETDASLILGADDLIDLQSHLLEEYQDNASWMMHRLIWAKVLKLKDDDGQYLLNPAILFSGVQPQLLGTTVRLAGDMPKPDGTGALTAGQLIVVYADFRETYTILDRLGINVIRDNITKSGFVNWYFRGRYGGGVTNFQAMKRLQVKS